MFSAGFVRLIGYYYYGFNGRLRLVQARVEMDTIPEAGFCECPSCCDLRWRETGPCYRPPLAIGLQLVHGCWKASF